MAKLGLTELAIVVALVVLALGADRVAGIGRSVKRAVRRLY
jgi:Sec-independent protein translocase protein TatA